MWLVSLLLFPFHLTWWCITLPFSYPVLAWPFFLAGFSSIIVYLIIALVQFILKKAAPIDLKVKYNAEWALVTGASSGIGREIVEKLAGQGINVVLVALADDLLVKTRKELQVKYPSLQFREVGVNLASGDYMTPMIKATEDIDVPLIFNNAGFITTGFFVDLPVERSLGNYECNATCTIKITHHFAKRLTDKGLKGLIAFTSSSAGFIPGPLSSMYASTKAFMTMFAASIAGELKPYGVDVLCVHPSPIASNFFKNAGGLSALLAFEKFASPPSVIADVMFANAGRFVLVDDGLVSLIFRVFLKSADFNFLAEMIGRFSYMSGDFAKLKKKN